MKIEYVIKHLLKDSFKYEDNIRGQRGKYAIFYTPHKKAVRLLGSAIRYNSIYVVPGRFVLKLT